MKYDLIPDTAEIIGWKNTEHQTWEHWQDGRTHYFLTHDLIRKTISVITL